MENIQSLESEIRELAKKCDLESVLREELNLEIQTLQRSQGKRKAKEAFSIPQETASINASSPITYVSPSSENLNQPTTSVKYSIEGPIVSEIAFSREIETNISQNKNENIAPMENTNSEINKILARIEQDNRILAELEKSRATVDAPLVPPVTDKERSVSISKQSVTRQELELLMAKLEQDNRILAELDKKRNILESFSSSMTPKSPSFISNNAIHGHHSIMLSPSPSLGSLKDPTVSLNLHGLTASTSSVSLIPVSHTLIPTSLFQRFAIPGDVALTEDEMLDSIDFIELPGRGRCNIYCARYTYDPLKQSPNENPEAELALNAGDYVIIYGEMDEDGFFNGELLDGRKGLVPSNFVEKLTGEELFEFHATVLYGNRDSDDSSVSFSYAQDMEMTVSDDLLHPEDFHRMNDYVDLDDVEEVDQDNDDDDKENEHFALGVPPPQRLILERQMNKSLLIGWVPPDVTPGRIEGYHVYVDGVPKATIQFSERTRALIEGVDSTRPHRVSVRSISSTGFHSKDAACTIVVGKDFPLAPTCVKASHVTASSALISWLPSNSNFQHVIAVNSVEVKIVKPGCFRHHVTGLSPNTLYRVSVRVKPGKLLYNDEKNPKKLEMLVSNVEFKTLPKGLPDPPVNVSVEQGPQDGSILVTWLPAMTNPASSFVSQVTGYAVFAASKKIAEIDSPTGDHALIDGQQLLALNKKTITVKSKSVDGFSSDSLVCVVPNELLRNAQKTKPKILCKVDSINEVDDDLENTSSRESKLTRRINQNTAVPNPRRQGWHSYNNRSTVEEPRNIREHKNSSRQIILDSDEDKEIYPSIPSIEITRDIMDEDSRRRPSSPERYAVSSSQERPLRTAHHHRERRAVKQDRRRGEHSFYNKRSPPCHFSDPMSRYEHQSDSSNVDQGDNRVRFFVALFDYDPQTMSPNPDAADEELPFQEGQMIKIYGDKDADGFYRGESNGRTGLVPGNMVSEVQIDGEPYNDNIPMLDRDVEWSERRIKKMVAIYDYDPQEISPNVDAEMELSFNVGDLIYVIGDVDEDGFYIGELNGMKGLVPSNFLREDINRPRGYREDYQHRPDTMEHSERNAEKSHFSTSAGHKISSMPASTLWIDRERGPPPRGQRMGHPFTGSSPSSQHW